MRGTRLDLAWCERPLVRNAASQQVKSNVAASLRGTRLGLVWCDRSLVRNATSEKIKRSIALSLRTSQGEES
jgi:hypothetical protein